MPERIHQFKQRRGLLKKTEEYMLGLLSELNVNCAGVPSPLALGSHKARIRISGGHCHTPGAAVEQTDPRILASSKTCYPVRQHVKKTHFG